MSAMAATLATSQQNFVSTRVYLMSAMAATLATSHPPQFPSA
jgi:hypothetical protein